MTLGRRGKGGGRLKKGEVLHIHEEKDQSTTSIRKEEGGSTLLVCARKERSERRMRGVLLEWGGRENYAYYSRGMRRRRIVLGIKGSTISMPEGVTYISRGEKWGKRKGVEGLRPSQGGEN